ncbi:MAG: endolytic transglycosylase MltG [Bacteroidetes bacterium]|nr:endolytic transglycosylase MltG [Bacteroidota bacterium]
MNLKNIFASKNKLTIHDWYLPVQFFGVLLGIFLFIFYYPNTVSNKQGNVFEIPQGSSFARVSSILYQEGIVPNKFNFRLAAFLYGAESKLRAGRYEIPSGLNYFELLDYLVKGGHDEQKLITIPEGIWQNNLAKLLKEKLGVDSSSFMALSNNRNFLDSLGIKSKTLEGYLLPETYYFYTNSNAREIINKLFIEMNGCFGEVVNKRLEELKMSKNEILTLASIIEAESNIAKEYKRISGVYHNRLKKWMRLEADPTIQYLKRYQKHNRILYKDLEIDSPFNTYKNYGLPPAPINNPGKDAIEAALFPEENDYYYFVADGTGSHLFARTYKEHLKNVELYREWRESQ